MFLPGAFCGTIMNSSYINVSIVRNSKMADLEKFSECRNSSHCRLKPD